MIKATQLIGSRAVSQVLSLARSEALVVRARSCPTWRAGNLDSEVGLR